MRISKLLNNLQAIQVVGNARDNDISDITIDSREVRSGSLFVAIKGFVTDGHKFIDDVISKNAAAIVIDDPNAIPEHLLHTVDCTKILVKDSRKALAQLSNTFWNEPSKKLTLIGITGTKGKTTTSYYLKNLLETAGFKTGLIGTISNFIGDEEIKTKLTTPESNRINKLMNEMVRAGCTHCIMEVSSHSLELNRVQGLDFNFALFTNITSDHLDFHENFGRYLAAKKTLFDLIEEGSKAIVNIDDKSFSELIRHTKADVIKYGFDKSSEYSIADVSYDLSGTRFSVNADGEEYNFSTTLIGKFNAYNAAAAFAVGHQLGIEKQKLIDGINFTPQIPGRFEVVKRGSKTVVVDYSHTAGSLEEALTAIQKIVDGKNKVHTVFGCGGDRDKTKRPIMGEVASRLSDKVYVTSDNPRTEEPMKIIEDILPGIKNKNYAVLESRDEAIKTAIKTSEENAVILIAGKGHETYQEINGVRNYFSDKETAKKYLEEYCN
jgi:UDP-N-acetylmuramoyl-L-alanyl-D-glutamate--2,6-diaminopimelate ligase